MSRSIHQRYQREFWPAMVAYMAIMFLLWPLLPQVHSELLKIALAVLPVVPVLFVVRAMVRLVLGSDELEQRIHLIGLAIAATVVSTLSLAGGFLAAAGVLKLDGAILIWVWPTLVVVYAAGRSWASRRYGGSDVMCNNGIAWHWRLLFAALGFAGIAGLGRHQLLDYQLGMLCGMSAALAGWALVLAVLRWRRRHGRHETL
ncbi:hypothetical protein GCM10008098_29600 [Rhodanobacter panaciterrae]|uniref:Transmembrane protein n=1 Tax=Rhodanobacter panaciterrae TaxID=490572 RepID=A0ABQ3A764_9GAMM|nr:hypothetical protein [Rhodanobacter panaciterrae]GGY34503.1 hypothetical protein GCM10008098_29600 [Rhodanobacter panaciterrae]